MSSDLHQDIPQYFGFGVCSSASCTKRSQELMKQTAQKNKNDESGNLEDTLINERDGSHYQTVQRHNSVSASKLTSNYKDPPNLNFLSASKETSFPQTTFGDYPVTRQYPLTVMNFSHDQQQPSTPYTTPSSNKFSQIPGNNSPQLTDFGRISYNSPSSVVKQIGDPGFSGILQLKDKEIKGQFKQETLSKKSSTDCSDHSKTQISGKISELHTPVKIAEKPSQLQGDIDANKLLNQQFPQQNKLENNQGVCLNSEESEKDNEEHRAQSGSKLSGSRVIDFSGSEVHEYSARNNKQSHRNSQVLEQGAFTGGSNNTNNNRIASPPRIHTPLPSIQQSRSAKKQKQPVVPDLDVQMGTSAIVKKANQYLCHQPSQLVSQPTPTNKASENQLLKHQSTQPLFENAEQISQMNLTSDVQILNPNLLLNKNEKDQNDNNSPFVSSIKKYPIRGNANKIEDSNQKRCQSADQSYLRKAHEILESAAKLSDFTPEHLKERKSPRKMTDKIKDTFRIINQEEILNQYFIEPPSKAVIILKTSEFSHSARDTNHSTALIGHSNIGQEDNITKQQEFLPENQQQVQLFHGGMINPMINQVPNNLQGQEEKEEQVKKAYLPRSSNDEQTQSTKYTPEYFSNNQAIINKLLEDSERITKEAIDLVAKKNIINPSYNLPSGSEQGYQSLPNGQEQQISMRNRFQSHDPLEEHTQEIDKESEFLGGCPRDNDSDLRFPNSPQFESQQQQIFPQSQQYNQSLQSEQQFRSISSNVLNHHQSYTSMVPTKIIQPRKSVSPANNPNIIPVKTTKSSELKQKVAQEKLRGQHEEEQRKRERLELRLDQERKRQESHENQIKEQNRILRLQNQKLKEQNNLLLNKFEGKLHDSEDTSIASKRIKDGSPKGKYQVDISSITNSQSSTQSKQLSSQTSPKVKLRSHSNQQYQQFQNNEIPKNHPQIPQEMWSPPDSSTSKPSHQLFRNNSLNSITSLLNSSTQEKQPNSQLNPNANNMQFLSNPAEFSKQQICQYEPQGHNSLQIKGQNSSNPINSTQIPQQGIQYGNSLQTQGKLISNQLGNDIASNKYLLVNAAISKGSNSKIHEGRQGLLEVTQGIQSARNDKLTHQSAPFQQPIVTSSTRQQALLARFKKPNFNESNCTLSNTKAPSNISCDTSKISCSSSASSKVPIKTNFMGSSARSSKSVHSEDNKQKEFEENNESVSPGSCQSKLSLKSCQIPKRGYNSQIQSSQVNKNNSNYPGTAATTAIQIDLKSNSSAQGRIRSQSPNQQAAPNKGNNQNSNTNGADAIILDNAMSSIFQKIENCYNDIGSVYNLSNQQAHN